MFLKCFVRNGMKGLFQALFFWLSFSGFSFVDDVFPRRKSGIDVIMNALGTVEGQDCGFVDAKLVPGRPIGVGFFKPVGSPPKDGLVAEVRHEFGFEFKLSYPNCWVCWIVCLDSHGLYCCTYLYVMYRGKRTKKASFCQIAVAQVAKLTTNGLFWGEADLAPQRLRCWLSWRRTTRMSVMKSLPLWNNGVRCGDAWSYDMS